MCDKNNSLVFALVVITTIVLVSMFIPALAIITITRPVEITNVLADVLLTEFLREFVERVRKN